MRASAALLAVLIALPAPLVAAPRTAAFKIEEATIQDIQSAILKGQITSTGVVKMYLARIKAYDGTCVNQPGGVLGPFTTIKHAGQINALTTVNLRPAARAEYGLGPRKARSMTDASDNDPTMPDALEVAAKQDAYFKMTGKLVGRRQSRHVCDCRRDLGLDPSSHQEQRRRRPRADAGACQPQRPI